MRPLLKRKLIELLTKLVKILNWLTMEDELPSYGQVCQRCFGTGHIYEKKMGMVFSRRCPVCNRKSTWLHSYLKWLKAIP